MSGRPRHSQAGASEDPYKIWRPQERQVESDSERPRYRTTNTSQSQRNQGDGRYYGSSRGYKSDSPTTASASQHRSGPSSSKPLHHPSRSSVSNNYASRSQQPAASSSTTPTPQVQHHPRSQPQRLQTEAYSSRVYLHNKNTSTPTPQSSHERVPNADEFTNASRSNPYSRTGYATQVPQPTSTPEVWLPPTHDPSLSRKPRDRDRERDRERDRDRDREKETARDRNRERERPKDADRRRERDTERRDDAYRDPSRDVYRDRDRERDKVREKDKYQERRMEDEREPVSHRELRSISKPTFAHDTRTRDPTATSTSNHRRHRSEEAPLSSATAWRPPIDSKQHSVTAPPAQKPAPASVIQTTTSGGQANVPPPTPRVIPVYLPAKQPSAHKPSHERSYSTPAALAQKENSTSDSEQPSRRDLQSRTVNDSRLATNTSTIKDNGILRSQKDQTDRPSETTLPKSKHEARYQSTRSKPLGTQPPSVSVLKPLDIGENTLQVPSGRLASSLSVLPAESRRHASAKPQIVSIRAGQGPSDPQTSDALFKKSARSTRENRADVLEQPSTSIQLPTNRVQEQVKRYEAVTPIEVLSTSSRVHTSNVEQNPRSTPTKAYTSQASAAPASQDRPQTREATTRADVTASRSQAGNVEPNDRSRSTFQEPTHQPTSANRDRSQSDEVFVRPEQTTSTPSRVYTSGVEPNNRLELAPKSYTYQFASANSGLQQFDEASIKPDMMTSTFFRARTTDIETNHRSAPTPKPSISQAAEAVLPNRLPKARTVRFDLPPPSPSPPPVPTPIGTAFSAPHTSRSVTVGANEARSSPILEPFVPPSSSGFRQTATPPLQSNQKLSSYPQPEDLNASHLPRVIDRESLPPSAAYLPVTSSQPQVTAGEMSSSPSTAPQASPARSVTSQVENRQAEFSQRSAERTLTPLAPPLTAVSSQSQSTPPSAHTTPPQSTSRSTKASDAPSARQYDKHGPPVEQKPRQDALQVDVRNQPPAPSPQIPSTADQHRTFSEPPREVVVASATESSSAGVTSSIAAPAVNTSPTMHSLSHTPNSGDAPPMRQEHVTHSHLAAGDAIQFPAVSPNYQKTHTYAVPQPDHGTGRQLQPSSSEDARLPLEPAQRSAPVSDKGRDATIPGLGPHFSAEFVVQAHTQGNVMPAQSGGGHSRKNSIDVNATRPIIQHHVSIPQILVDDSPPEVPQRDASAPITANLPQPKSLPLEPILYATTSISTAPAPQTTVSRDMPDSEILPEPRSARLPNNVPLTSTNLTSTSASSQQPTIGSESSKSWALLNEDLLSPNVFSHKKQESSASQDAAEDTVLLRNQLRDEPSQAPAMMMPPVTHSADVGQFRSSQDPTLDDASRTMPSRSRHQSAKQPEKHSPRPPSVMDLPQSTIASTIKTEPRAVPTQQPVSARAILHSSHPEDLGQRSGSFNNQRGGLPKTTLSAAKYVSQSTNPDELRSPQPLNPITSTPVKGDLHPKDIANDHKAVRQRDQDDTKAPPTALERHGDTYRSASRAPPGVTSCTQDPPPRFPVIEDVMQRPSTTASRPERQKFSYGPASTSALDPHHNHLSPVQQAIRAVPPPQIQPRSLSHDTQTSDVRSHGQTDVPSAMSSQHITSRSQPYSTAPIHVPPTSSVPPLQSSNSAPMNVRQVTSSNGVNPYAPSRLDESITPQRTTQSSAYPPASRYPAATTYPTASNRSDSQPTATPHVQQPGPQNPYFTSASQQAARYASSVQYSQSPPVPDIPQSNFLSRASDAARKTSVNRVQAYPEPHLSAPNPTTLAQESTGTHRHNVSLTNATTQPTAMPHLPAQKSSSSSIKPPPPHPAPHPPPASSYYLRPDLQQPTLSTLVSVSGPSSTSVPSRSRLPSQPSRNTSKESILMTPSSLAPSMLPKTDHSRVPPMTPISRQESNQSKDSSKKKNGFLNMFRSKTPAQKSYEVWHPPAFDKQRNQSQSSLQSITGKVPVLASSSSTIDGVASTSQRKAPAPIAVNLPLHAAGRKEPDQKVFSAFKFLHTKRNRTVSHASVEAQDGQTQTATNTVVGSPTQSNRSQPFAPPPVRDPQLAAQEWRNREEAEMRSRAKRRRPGVVFDMEEDPPEPPPGTVPKKKLSRRRQ